MRLHPLHTVLTKCSHMALILLLVTAVQRVKAQATYDTAEAVVEAPDEEEYDEDYSDTEKNFVPDTVSFREVPQAATDSLKRAKEFAYANDPDYWRKEPEPQPEKSSGKSVGENVDDFFAGKAVRTFMYILIGAVILFLIYRVIVQNNLYIFYFSKKYNMEEDAGEVEMNRDTIDDRIQKAITEKNHRLAVRYYYIKALQLLNEKGLIRLHAQATNYHYLQQMSGNRLAYEFRFLTEVYDYVWYGEFALSENQFDRVNTNFQSFFKAI